MNEINLNEQFIVYVIYKGCSKWFLSDKEIWYLNYEKRIEAYKKIGYEIKLEYIDEKRRDLLYISEDKIPVFLKRIEADECTIDQLKSIYLANEKSDNYMPALYVDFDQKILYSMYNEPASYEDYAMEGWNTKYKNFLEFIPKDRCYWNGN